MANNNGGFAQFKGWQGLIVTAGVLIVLYFVAKLFFKVLYLVAPVLLIATVFLYPKVILGYFKNIGGLFKKNPLFGIGAGVLSAIFYPVVIGFLFAQALLYRKSDKVQQQFEDKQEGEYVAYEEIEHTVEAEDLLEDFNKKDTKAEEDLDYWDLLSDDDPPKRKDVW